MDITWAEQRVAEPPMIANADFKDYLLHVFGHFRMPSSWEEALQLYFYLIRVSQ